MALTLQMTFQPYGATPPATVEVLSASVDGEQVLNIGSQASGAGAGKVTFNPFTFTRKPDGQSASLWSRLCSGTAYQKVTLAVTPSGSNVATLTFTMGLVAVKTISISASEADASPMEVVTLEYGQAAYSVTPQNPDGTFGTAVAAGWDRVRNVQEDPVKIGSGIQ